MKSTYKIRCTPKCGVFDQNNHIRHYSPSQSNQRHLEIEIVFISILTSKSLHFISMFDCLIV